MKIISAGHIERASECESSDYENCSSSVDSLGTYVGHLPLKPYPGAYFGSETGSTKKNF